MFGLSKDLDDQNFNILDFETNVLCVVFALQEYLCLVLFWFCKMYGIWILVIVLGGSFLCRWIEFG